MALKLPFVLHDQVNSHCYFKIYTASIRQHGSAVYVGMVVVVCIP